MAHANSINIFDTIEELTRHAGKTRSMAQWYPDHKHYRILYGKHKGYRYATDGHDFAANNRKLLRELDRKHDGLRYRIFGAIQRGEIDGFKEIAGMQGKKAYRETEEE